MVYGWAWSVALVGPVWCKLMSGVVLMRSRCSLGVGVVCFTLGAWSAMVWRMVWRVAGYGLASRASGLVNAGSGLLCVWLWVAALLG